MVVDCAVDVNATVVLTSLGVAPDTLPQLQLSHAVAMLTNVHGRFVDVSDKGGAHVHGAVDDHVSAHVDRTARRTG